MLHSTVSKSKRGRSPSPGRLQRLHAAVFLHSLEASGRPHYVCSAIARKLGVSLAQLQCAALQLEAAGFARVAATERGLLVHLAGPRESRPTPVTAG
jgi:hypothetical protein